MAKTTIRRRVAATGGATNSPPLGEQLAAPSGWYTKLLTTHPVKTRAITLAIFNLVGDVFTQIVVEKAKSLDYRRVASMTAFGLFFVGPTLHFWYGFMNTVVKASGVKGATVRVVMDQICFAPIFIAITFAILLLLEGHPEKIQPKIQNDWKPTLIANWKLWIPFQFCNFMFMPPILQVLFSNIVGLGWNVYISWVSHRPTGQTAAYKRVAPQIPQLQMLQQQPPQLHIPQQQPQQLLDTQQILHR